jgi:hypothetical protein
LRKRFLIAALFTTKCVGKTAVKNEVRSSPAARGLFALLASFDNNSR